MFQDRKKRKIYMKYIFAICILLTGAVFGPQLLFAVQDMHNQESTWLGARDSMDTTALNVRYTEVLGERLNNYAKGLAEDKKYYANVTDYKVDVECYKLMDTVWNSEWVSLFDAYLAVGIYESIYVEGYNVEQWKRYTIYDEEFENGVAFMAWYFELNTGDGKKIKLLVDTEDYTLYYAEMEVVEKVYDYYGFDDRVKKATSELLEYIMYYYGAETEEKTFNVKERKDAYSVVGVVEDSVIEVVKDYMVYMREGLYNIILPYEEGWLHWELELTEESKEKPERISIGIMQIGELIPEFNE